MNKPKFWKYKSGKKVEYSINLRWTEIGEFCVSCYKKYKKALKELIF